MTRSLPAPGQPRCRGLACQSAGWTAIAALAFLLLALSLGLAGCTGSVAGNAVDKIKTDANAVELTSDGLQLVRSTPRARLWVKPDHHIGKYDNVMVAGIGFSYGSGQERLDSEQEKQVGEMLKAALAGITGDGPLHQADQPGPCTVSMELILKDIYLHISETTGSTVSYVSSFGSATMVVEFRDSTTNVPLVRYAANRGLGGGPGTGQVGANLGSLGTALSKMVTDMTTELKTITPDTTVRAETECNEGIYKWSGRG